MTSHPSRVRGSKRELLGPVRHADAVAPLAGAWIETLPVCPAASVCAGRIPRGCVDRHVDEVLDADARAVALLAGAWIETLTRWDKDARKWMSHPSRVRRSKHISDMVTPRRGWVAPLSGAWIETRAP